MTVSKLYSLPVERVDGKRRGYVLAVIKEGDGVGAIACADENEREFYIEPKGIIRAADRIIYQTECAKRTRKNTIRLNLPAYDGRGKFMGYAEDFTLKDYTFKNCIINGRTYQAERVMLGDIALLCDKNDAPAAIAAKDMFLEAIVGGAQ